MADLNRSERFEEWFKSFISASRIEFSDIPAKYDRRSFNLIDFSPPRQVVALWYDVDGRVIQHVFVTNDPNRSDLDIVAIGPLPLEDMERQMSAVLRLPTVQVPLEPDDASLHGGSTYADVLKERFLRIAYGASHISELPKHEGEASVGAQMSFVYHGFYWLAIGDLTNTEPIEIARGLINEAIESIERARNPAPLPPEVKVEELKVEGYAGRFLPRLWLGKKPTRSFEQRLATSVNIEWTFFTCAYKEHFVRAEDRSSIFIQAESEPEALRLLNEIAGGLLLSGIPCFAFRPGTIYKTSYQSRKVGANTYNTFGGPPVTMDEARYFGLGGVSEEQLRSFREVPKEMFLSILDKVGKSVDYEGKSDHLRVLVESYTDLAGANYKAAFIGSWTIIENYCKTQWFILKENASFPHAYRLAKKLKTSPKPAFAELDRSRHFDRPRARDFSRLYRIRSRAAHSRMYTPTKDEAVECYEEAEKLVRRELSFS